MLLLKPRPKPWTWSLKIRDPKMQMEKQLDAEKRLEDHIVC